MLPKIETRGQSSLLRRRRRRSIRRESFGERSISDRSILSEEDENIQKNSRAGNTDRMSIHALGRSGSTDFNGEEGAHPRISTSLERAALLPSPVNIPHHSIDIAGMKVDDEPSGNYRLAEELLTGKMSVGSSSSHRNLVERYYVGVRL